MQNRLQKKKINEGTEDVLYHLLDNIVKYYDKDRNIVAKSTSGILEYIEKHPESAGKLKNIIQLQRERLISNDRGAGKYQKLLFLLRQLEEDVQTTVEELQFSNQRNMSDSEEY